MAPMLKSMELDRSLLASVQVSFPLAVERLLT